MRALALLLALTTQAAADIDLLETGITCPERREGTRIPAPDTDAGFVLRFPFTDFDATGNVVPLLPDLSFGLRVVRDGAGPLPVTITVTHPPMGAERRTRQSWQSVLEPGQPGMIRYGFDFPHELLPGTWTLAVTAANGDTVSVSFRMVAPAALPDLCAGALSS